ncbi:MAG: LysR substrate-binding domain-containing protein [Cardiobacteriaceae bacterium]|nr:LysR substrate-binding domain-containing protein [Cardiobacteriaceae bacterium]
MPHRAITLEQLRAFVAIADSGNISQAAAALARTQSTLSAALKRLEEETGQPLIERRQGQVTGLTPAGERFLPAARDILLRMDHACAHLHQPPLTGRIRLGIPDDFDPARLHDILARCLAEHPALQLEITAAGNAALRTLVEAQALDLAIGKTLPAAPLDATRAQVLRHDTLCWVAAAHLEVAAQQSLPLVTFPEGCIIREAALHALRATGRVWHIAYSSASFANVRAAALAGLGVALLPQHALHPALVPLPHDAALPAVPEVSWVLTRYRDDALCRRFAEVLCERFAIHPEAQ